MLQYTTLGSLSRTLSPSPYCFCSQYFYSSCPNNQKPLGRLPSSAKLGVSRALLERNRTHIWLFQNLLFITQGSVSPPCWKGTSTLMRGGQRIQNHLSLLLVGFCDVLAHTYVGSCFPQSLLRAGNLPDTCYVMAGLEKHLRPVTTRQSPAAQNGARTVERRPGHARLDCQELGQ